MVRSAHATCHVHQHVPCLTYLLTSSFHDPVVPNRHCDLDGDGDDSVDDDDFISREMCCACGGGRWVDENDRPVPTPTTLIPTRAPTPAPSVEGTCVNTDDGAAPFAQHAFMPSPFFSLVFASNPFPPRNPPARMPSCQPVLFHLHKVQKVCIVVATTEIFCTSTANGIRVNDDGHATCHIHQHALHPTSLLASSFHGPEQIRLSRANRDCDLDGDGDDSVDDDDFVSRKMCCACGGGQWVQAGTTAAPTTPSPTKTCNDVDLFKIRGHSRTCEW